MDDLQPNDVASLLIAAGRIDRTSVTRNISDADRAYSRLQARGLLNEHLLPTTEGKTLVALIEANRPQTAQVIPFPRRVRSPDQGDLNDFNIAF